MPAPQEDTELEKAFKMLTTAKSHKNHRGIKHARETYTTAVSAAMKTEGRGFVGWYWMSGFLEPGSSAAEDALRHLEKLARPAPNPNTVDLIERLDNDQKLLKHRRQTLGDPIRLLM